MSEQAEKVVAIAPLTEPQARKIASIVASADGYCYVCAGDLCDQLASVWPQWPWRKWADV